MKAFFLCLGLLLFVSAVTADNTLFFNVSYQKSVILSNGEKSMALFPAENANVSACVGDTTNLLGTDITSEAECQQVLTDSNGQAIIHITKVVSINNPSISYVVVLDGYDIIKNKVSLKTKNPVSIADSVTSWADRFFTSITRIWSGQWDNRPTGSFPVSVDDAYVNVVLIPSIPPISWMDIFPGCGLEQNSNPVRCGLEFVLPNLHLSAIGNLIVLSLKNFFSLPTYLSNGNLGEKLVMWLLSIVTPFIMIFVITGMTLVLIWLEIGLTFLGWSAVFDILFHARIITKNNFLAWAGGFVVLTLILSFAFLSVDIGVWKNLISF